MKIAIHNKEDLLLLLKANGSKIRSYGVAHLSLFGSFAKDISNTESDVDLLVSFNPQQKTFDNYMDLSFFLEELLGRRVELVTPQSLSKYIGPHILNHAINVAI